MGRRRRTSGDDVTLRSGRCVSGFNLWSPSPVTCRDVTEKGVGDACWSFVSCTKEESLGGCRVVRVIEMKPRAEVLETYPVRGRELG